MIRKLLIANRAEIACRIIRTAKALGIHTVAVYSDADQHAMHVQLADEAARLGPAQAKESYLAMEKLLRIAKDLEVDAIHPGYGFLSENAKFARACEKQKVTFIGPPAQAIEVMGSKSAAKQVMQKAGVPLVPGYHGEDQSTEHLKKQAETIGFPVLLKATAGGGGKGMRIVWSANEFDDALASAKREAAASFDNDTMLIEKYLTAPRHVEVQVFCDSNGNGVYLFERDCSVQRRHQKVIEEAPAPGLSSSLRSKMGNVAVKAAMAINYVGAGTVEFLLDEDNAFYFMEMNTRLQVEHPVTEYVTGEDLVAWQIDVAEGKPLPKTQNQLTLNGHAFEARIYAEDPDNDFLPATGRLKQLATPAASAHVRVDIGVREGDEVSVYYDPMIAKLITWDSNREQALARLEKALAAFYVEGVKTNIDFLGRVARHEAFQRAELTTTFIEDNKSSLFSTLKFDNDLLPVMALATLLPRKSATSYASHPDGWRMNARLITTVSFEVNAKTHTLTVCWPASRQRQWLISNDNTTWSLQGNWDDTKLVVDNGRYKRSYHVFNDENQWVLRTPTLNRYPFVLLPPDKGENQTNVNESTFTAPMNGTIVACPRNQGERVKEGTSLLVMEAMKMEHTIRAPFDGTLNQYYCKPGDLIDGGRTLLEFIRDTSQNN